MTLKQRIHNYMADQHGVNLLDTDIEEIIRFVEEQELCLYSKDFGLDSIHIGHGENDTILVICYNPEDTIIVTMPKKDAAEMAEAILKDCQ
jgi:hypothetical protein